MKFGKFYLSICQILVLSATVTFILTRTVHAQNGYIHLHLKTLNEESSPNFNFTITGGPTHIPERTLRDHPNTFQRIFDLGVDAGGGVYALAAQTEGEGNSGYLYYKAPGADKWSYVRAGAFRLDGAGKGGVHIYREIVRDSASRHR